jgi:hypothetical protein
LIFQWEWGDGQEEVKVLMVNEWTETIKLFVRVMQNTPSAILDSMPSILKSQTSSSLSLLNILLKGLHHFTTTNKMPPFWTIGALYGATSVAFGAFGAHGLKKRISDPAKLANWSTAANYQVQLSSPFPSSFSINNLAHPFRDPPPRNISRTEEHPRSLPLRSRNDHV